MSFLNKLFVNYIKNYGQLNYSTSMIKHFQPNFGVGYRQGQIYTNNIKEYFFYIDRNGRLFLDDDLKKNNSSVINNQLFLEFFFKRLQLNDDKTNRYHNIFPYKICYNENCNYLRSEYLPIVYTKLFQSNEKSLLSYCKADELLTIAFKPNQMYLSPKTGLIYHPATIKQGQIGILAKDLANILKNNFTIQKYYTDDNDGRRPPTHFKWNSIEYKLNYNWLRNLKNKINL